MTQSGLYHYASQVFDQVLQKLGHSSVEQVKVMAALYHCFKTDIFDLKAFSKMAEAIPGFTTMACEVTGMSREELIERLRFDEGVSPSTLSEIAFLMDRHFLQDREHGRKR